MQRCKALSILLSAHCELAQGATPSPAPDRQSALTLWSSCLTIYGDEIAGLSLHPLVRPLGLRPQNPTETLKQPVKATSSQPKMITVQNNATVNPVGDEDDPTLRRIFSFSLYSLCHFYIIIKELKPPPTENDPINDSCKFIFLLKGRFQWRSSSVFGVLLS